MGRSKRHSHPVRIRQTPHHSAAYQYGPDGAWHPWTDVPMYSLSPQGFLTFVGWEPALSRRAPSIPKLPRFHPGVHRGQRWFAVPGGGWAAINLHPHIDPDVPLWLVESTIDELNREQFVDEMLHIRAPGGITRERNKLRGRESAYVLSHIRVKAPQRLPRGQRRVG